MFTLKCVIDTAAIYFMKCRWLKGIECVCFAKISHGVSICPLFFIALLCFVWTVFDDVIYHSFQIIFQRDSHIFFVTPLQLHNPRFVWANSLSSTLGWVNTVSLFHRFFRILLCTQRNSLAVNFIKIDIFAKCETKRTKKITHQKCI